MAKRIVQAATREPKDSPLNDNQKLFCFHYAHHGNATLAYHQAYPEALPTSCGTCGHRLLKNVEILEFIDHVKQERAQKVNFTRDDAIRILVEIATNPFHKQNREAANDLWEKLGFGKDVGREHQVSILERISALSGKLKRGGST